MKPLFNKVKMKRPGTNVFDLSHERKLSCKMAQLVPIYVEDVVPGDKFKVNTEILARLAPMIAPVMHRVNVMTHYFFVPNRLVWNEWESHITGGADGQFDGDFPYFMITEAIADQCRPGSLLDHMGVTPVPAGVTVGGSYGINALPFRAYQMIYNEYYRDQNLEPKVNFSVDSGTIADPTTLLTMRTRCWEKDYFTSALPWAQRGGDVLLPMEADINYSNTATLHVNQDNQPLNTWDGTLKTDASGNYIDLDSANPDVHVGVHNLESISNGSLTINDLRRATRLQEWLERNARAGSRYIEQIFAHFGVRSSDARLQRPEYLGGNKQPIVISEVLNTASTTTSEPLGTMGGHGISVGGDFAFSKFFEEHGHIIGIMSILPRTAYQQGTPRLFLKGQDKFDFYFPEFAHLGEQAVYNGELYFDYTGTVDSSETFGYQSRFSEYKFKESSVHGDFRTTLNYWHMGRIFDSPPELNAEFVHADPTNRVFAVTDPDVDKLYIQLYNRVRAIRPMPIFGTPSL